MPLMVTWPSLEVPGAVIMFPMAITPWSTTDGADSSVVCVPVASVDQGWDATHSVESQEPIQESQESPRFAEPSCRPDHEEPLVNILERSFVKEFLRRRHVLEAGGRVVLSIARLLHERSADGTLHPLCDEAKHAMKIVLYQAMRRVATRKLRGIAWRLDYEQMELQVHVAKLDDFCDSCALHSALHS